MITAYFQWSCSDISIKPLQSFASIVIKACKSYFFVNWKVSEIAELNRWHVKCLTKQTTVIWHVSIILFSNRQFDLFFDTTHTMIGVTCALTDLIALSTPRGIFAQKYSNYGSFSHFIWVISLPFLHNNTTSPKIERKRQKFLIRWKSDLIKLHFNLMPHSLKRTFDQFSYLLPLKISNWNECYQIKL